MAYGLKYNFKTTSNINAAEIECRILEDDYVGTVRIFGAGWGPRDCVIVATDNTELDPMSPMRTKAATLNVFTNCKDDAGNPFTETNIQDIFFSEDRKYKLEIYVNGNVYFLGWFTPQQQVTFSPYISGQMKFVFTCGLAQLRGINYEVPNTYNFEVQSFRTILNNCLDETGLGLDIRYSNTLYYDDSTKLLIDKVGIETTALRSSRGTGGIDCFTILEQMMRGIGSTLFQQDGKWQIQSFADKSQGTEKHATILYSNPTQSLTLSSGTFSTLPLLADTRKSVDRSMIINAFQPRSEVNGTASFTDHTHLTPNFLFRSFTGNNPNFWTLIDIITRKPSSGNGVEIKGYQNGSIGFGDALVSQDYNVKKGAVILIDWNFTRLIPIESPTGRVQISNDIGGGGVRYLDTDGTWSATEVWLQGNDNNFESVVQVADDGILSCRIGRPNVANGSASQDDYYVRCNYFDVTILNGRQGNDEINTEFDKTIEVVQTGRKFIFKDEELLHLGHNVDEVPQAIALDDLTDYYVTIHKDPITWNDLGAQFGSVELLNDEGLLMRQVARLRARILSANSVAIEVQMLGDYLNLFNIYTLNVLGVNRRMVVISNEISLRTQQQNVILYESKLGSETTFTYLNEFE